MSAGIIEPTDEGGLERLVARCRRGSRDAWDEMYRAHARLVTAVARRMRLSDAEVADVAQSVWMSLYEHLDDIREPRAVKSWLVTTTRHEAFAVLRRRYPATCLTTDVASDHEPAPDERLIDEESRQAMHRAWERLRPADQLILHVLVLNGQVDYQRAAQVLDRPTGSLGPTRQRALRRLRQLYDHELLRGARLRRRAGG